MMKLKEKRGLPIDLIKQYEINRLKDAFASNKGFEVLDPEGIEELEFYPDLLVKYMNDIFLIHFMDEYTDKNELFFLSVLSFSFKKKYREKHNGEVIILFYTKNNLSEEQIQTIKIAERIFDMSGEIDIRDIKEIDEADNYPNYLEQKIWYQYYAYFKKYKEKGAV